MAGGQGTRLGSSAPKGCYDIGLPSGKSLFRMQGERIGKLNELARASAAGGEEGEKRGGKLVWYVMTSGPTRKETERYFKENDWFGLDEEDVVFFDQGEFVGGWEIWPCGWLIMWDDDLNVPPPDSQASSPHSLTTARSSSKTNPPSPSHRTATVDSTPPSVDPYPILPTLARPCWTI
jgi:hypothetical protein